MGCISPQVQTQNNSKPNDQNQRTISKKQQETTQPKIQIKKQPSPKKQKAQSSIRSTKKQLSKSKSSDKNINSQKGLYSPSKVNLKIDEVVQKQPVKKQFDDHKIKKKIKKKKAVGDPKLSQLIKIYQL